MRLCRFDDRGSREWTLIFGGGGGGFGYEVLGADGVAGFEFDGAVGDVFVVLSIVNEGLGIAAYGSLWIGEMEGLEVLERNTIRERNVERTWCESWP